MTVNEPRLAVRRIAIPATQNPFVNACLLPAGLDGGGEERFWISSWNSISGSLGLLVSETGGYRRYSFGPEHPGFYSAVAEDTDTLWLCGNLSRVVRLSLHSGEFQSYDTGAQSGLMFQGMVIDPVEERLFSAAFAPPVPTAFSFDLLRLVAAGGAGVVLAPVAATAAAAGAQPRSGSGELVVWARTSSEKVMLDTQLPADNNPRISLAGARNGRESAQLILRTSAAPTDARVIVTPPRKRGAIISPDNVSIFHQHYIEVTDPQDNKVFDKFPAGWYPDALLPLGQADPVPVTPDGNTALWISVDIPDNQPPGIYVGDVIVISSEGTTRIPLDIRVWDFSLNVENQGPTAFAIWYSRMAAAHDLELDSPEYFALADKYYKFQLDHRLPSNSLPIPATDDPQTFIELAEPYLSDPRVTAFNVPYFQTSTTTIDTAKVAQVVALLRDRGWLSRGYFYLGNMIDEPKPEKYPVVRALAQQLTDVAPDVPHVVTHRPAGELADDVHTWAFNIMSADPTLFQWIRDPGDVAWWYPVGGSTYPYPSFHIDDSLLGTRLMAWMQHDFGIKGWLYWATTIFDKYNGDIYVPRDPWTDPMATPGTNGEGFLLYPGKQIGIDGPVGTNRLEAVRDGLEDLEYLGLFQDGMAQIATSLGIDGAVSPSDTLRTYFDARYSRPPHYKVPR